ncbi:MAG: ATP-binding protein [Acidimicrobiaceae bacterium]|nr:ATP-binding protein [Acidimicrobiaceae bacterium]
MLLRFEVGNHRSISEPVELSMIAMDKDREAARKLEGVDEKVLTVAAVYGANGSGKTNLIDGLAWMEHALISSLRMWEDSIPNDPFSFGSGPSEYSSFGVDLVVDGVRYRYELKLDGSAVRFEALYSYPQRRRRTVFKRNGNDLSFRRGTRLTGGGRELITNTTLVMSVAGRLTDEIKRVARYLRDIRFVNVWPRAFIPNRALIHRRHIRWRARPDWDDYLMDVFDEQTPPDTLREEETGGSDWRKSYLARQQHRSLALAMLKFADFGVQDVEVVDDVTADGGGPRRLRLLHNVAGDSLPLELGQESDGTLTWLSLMPDLMTVLRNGGVLVVDELDSSLHTVISGKLIEMFQDPETNRNGAQIIFTTHDTSLLGCLNRDEVWLTSKRSDSSTELIPLSDFRGDRVRRSTNLERGYLEGRFGGVPVVDQHMVREALGLTTPN